MGAVLLRMKSTIVALFVCFACASARAEIWQGALPLEPKQLRLGFFGEIYAPSSNYSTAVMGFGQFAYGINDRWQIETRLGLGMVDFYLGVFGKYLIYAQGERGEDADTRELRRGPFAFSALFGIFRQVFVHVNLMPVASYQLWRFDFFLAPLIQVDMMTTSPSFAVIPGVNFSISKMVTAVIEGRMNVVNTSSSVSFGIQTKLGSDL